MEIPGHLVNYCATRRALKTDLCSPSDFQPQPVFRDIRALRFSRRSAQFHESEVNPTGNNLGLPARHTSPIFPGLMWNTGTSSTPSCSPLNPASAQVWGSRSQSSIFSPTNDSGLRRRQIGDVVESSNLTAQARWAQCCRMTSRRSLEISVARTLGQ